MIFYICQNIRQVEVRNHFDVTAQSHFSKFYVPDYLPCSTLLSATQQQRIQSIKIWPKMPCLCVKSGINIIGLSCRLSRSSVVAAKWSYLAFE